MEARDALRFALGAMAGFRLRSGLTLLAMAIGVAAVVVLSSLGEGARRYVVGQFEELGTHLLIVLPGRSETVGGLPPLLAETPRDLTIEDAEALRRRPSVRRVTPLTIGSAAVAWGGREREAPIIGTTAEFLEVRHVHMGAGRFLPPGDPTRVQPVCVLGTTVRDGLFGAQTALGQWVKIGDWRFQVIGVLASRGRSLGTDLDQIVIVPVASAQAMFNQFSLFRVLVEAASKDGLERARQDVIEVIKARHDGEDDVTVIAQDALVSTFDRILWTLTLALVGIAGISLVVAGILIMNVMLVSVSERTGEIGLMKALGAPPRQILLLFLLEAALLSLVGGLSGLGVGRLGTMVIATLYPQLDVTPPLWAIGAALGVALTTGIAFGVLPASRAARLEPVGALSRR